MCLVRVFDLNLRLFLTAYWTLHSVVSEQTGIFRWNFICPLKSGYWSLPLFPLLISQRGLYFLPVNIPCLVFLVHSFGFGLDPCPLLLWWFCYLLWGWMVWSLAPRITLHTVATQSSQECIWDLGTPWFSTIEWIQSDLISMTDKALLRLFHFSLTSHIHTLHTKVLS